MERESGRVIQWTGGQRPSWASRNAANLAAPTLGEAAAAMRSVPVRRRMPTGQGNTWFAPLLPPFPYQVRSLSIAKFSQQTCPRRLDHLKKRYRGAGYIRLL
jgi:hypothetical protein